MAMFFTIAKKSSLAAPLKLKALSSLQRLNHTLTETGTTQFYRHMGSDSEPCEGVIDVEKWRAVDARALGIKPMMIPQAPWTILSSLRGKGYEAYLVGGCVRDLLLHRIPKDFDVITTADLKEIQGHFNKAIIVGKRFPICHVHIKGSIIEVSSFNTEAQHGEKKTKILAHKPSGCSEKDFIRWSNSMKRDFTINSLFYDPFSSKIYDYANGMADLRSLKLRTLMPAQLSFKEDCARILRGLRIAARLGLSLSKEVKAAIHNHSSSIESLDKFRLMLELNYMMSYGAALPSLHMLKRFNLLQIFFPFHAAYLDQQAHKSYSSSNMLMKLFFHLDKLVSCDRPSDCNMWIGLLAFHMALVNNPQDELVLWAFASILYHGSWSEGVKIARKYAKGKVDFQPEVSGLSQDKSDKVLAKEVSQLAALVQLSLGALSKAEILAKVMSRYPDFPYSTVVFVSIKKVEQVYNIFDVIVRDIKSYEHGRKSFTINYKLLMKGVFQETRFVFGQILLQTMGDGPIEERKEESEQDGLLSDIIESSYPTHSDVGKSHTWVNNNKKHELLLSNLEIKQKVAKRSKLVEKQHGSLKELQLTIEKEFVEKSKERKNESETRRLPEGSVEMPQSKKLEKDSYQLRQPETTTQSEQTQKKEDCQEKARKHIKLAEMLSPDESKSTAIKKQPKGIKEENSKRSLSSIFRRSIKYES